MPDLIHFITEAVRGENISDLKESYLHLKQYHKKDIIYIELIYPYDDCAFICCTMWCEDASGSPEKPWEIESSMFGIKYKTIEPFFIEL